MYTRRQFLTHAAAGLLLQPTYISGKQDRSSLCSKVDIVSFQSRDETIQRYRSMNGDNWHMTWGADDLQYTSMCDGYMDLEHPKGRYNSRLLTIQGSAMNANFADVPGYPELIPSDEQPRYYNFGVLAVDRKIYQLLSTWPSPSKDDERGLRFMGVKLIYSDDAGRTWRNQDGSSPVRWEDWRSRSRDNTMLFYEEPQETFSLPSVLQMGMDYRDNRDGYVYIYSPNGNTEGTMNQLVMLRVKKERILDRTAYEYFAGITSNGSARWHSQINQRSVVHTFPSGWVNKTIHPWAWVPSVTYNAPLQSYMMASWATSPGPAPGLEWFSKPSYLGFWVSRCPWGPWRQVYECLSWTPGGDTAARCYSPIIAPKWVAADGKSFWVVWTDFQEMMTREQLSRRKAEIQHLTGREQARAAAALDRLNRPYYSFNVQRVDIVTT